METQAQTFEHVSSMPASTWHFLKMNDATVEIPAGLAISPAVEASVPWKAKAAADEFENALADAQEAWEATHPEPTAEEMRARAEYLEAEADATYGGTAQSAYQLAADGIEEARSLSAAFEHGLGDEVAAYLRYGAGGHIVVEADSGQAVEAEVVVTAMPGALSVAAVDVVADADSTVNLSIVVRDADAGAASEHGSGPGGAVASGADALDGGGADGAGGIAGTTVRVFADAGAHVSVVRTQALGEAFTDFDDMGLFTAEGARIDVRQTVLGAGSSYTGLAGDLRGDSSRIDVDTRYLGNGERELDFNYALRHHGVKTQCNLQANGVLAGSSSKTLRGTIDLVRGCKGAEGSENETVLLVDEDVRNKTIPVILCNEDDVAGNHGATIGHVRGEQLFYLASRGLSPEVAENMFAQAVLEQAALDAPTDSAREAVVNLGERTAPGFADLFV